MGRLRVRWLIALVLLLGTVGTALFLYGRAEVSTETRLRKLEEQRLRIQKASLQQTVSLLKDGRERDFEGFVSRDVVNQALAGLDGLEVVWPDLPDVKVTLRQVRWIPEDGFARLEILARADHVSTEFTAELRVLAFLAVDNTSDKGELAHLRIHVVDVVPELRWRRWGGKTGGFARRLLRAELAERLDGLGDVTLPLRHVLPLDSPPSSQTLRLPTGQGSVRGQATWPGFRGDMEVQVDEILFLRDGVHIGGSLVAEVESYG